MKKIGQIKIMVRHYVNRENWLRAAVLGANDGILSTTSLVIGVAAAELGELTGIYEQQGIDSILACKVAIELTQRNALEVHACEELGISMMTKPKPLQAGIASAAPFIT